ncbi:MAG: TldD/PmbA family protein [Lachnospiraceae bacterium]|jgi:TldD protein|nr:TldD/PmbA family protein [Lachnospiraceae bacterium]MCI9098165.1 TldD/PmbA family protein [Lachnospiraceae bacterium]
MYQFPEGFYTDVREETVHATTITIENGVLKENKTKKEQGVIIRLYDGRRWYISSTTESGKVQQEIDSLAGMAVFCPNIEDDPVVKKYEINQEVQLRYKDCDVSLVPNAWKLAVAEQYADCLKACEKIPRWKVYYVDNHTRKHIVSSKGCDVTFDTQNCCVAPRYVLMKDEKPFYGRKDIYRMKFEELKGHEKELEELIREDLDYNENAVPVEPGEYTCIFSPAVTGVFAHESFGHKSEADFMVGDENMKREWAIGTRVGAELLNIVDTGMEEGSGYVPFDDEGTRAKKTYLIRDGILSGRLHSAMTAAALKEELTGNARAVSFQFEPIVRMTATYVEPGKSTKEELIAGVKKGIYISDYNHGSGMSTFTIAPNKAYMIRDGHLAEPVKISVITGNVMHTLHEIDGLSAEFELCSFALGGCGKMEQFPLRVGMGGPYMRVNHLTVQ